MAAILATTKQKLLAWTYIAIDLVRLSYYGSMAFG
jgi:hypothetical protein